MKGWNKNYKWNYVNAKTQWLNEWKWNSALPYLDKASALYHRLKVYLRILDREPDDLARLFERQGIKGKRLDGKTCPVAQYLKATPALGVSEVGHDYIVVKGEVVPTPPKLKSFIYRFDSGYYPQLETR